MSSSVSDSVDVAILKLALSGGDQENVSGKFRFGRQLQLTNLSCEFSPWLLHPLPHSADFVITKDISLLECPIEGNHTMERSMKLQLDPVKCSPSCC